MITTTIIIISNPHTLSLDESFDGTWQKIRSKEGRMQLYRLINDIVNDEIMKLREFNDNNKNNYNDENEDDDIDDELSSNADENLISIEAYQSLSGTNFYINIHIY